MKQTIRNWLYRLNANRHKDLEAEIARLRESLDNANSIIVKLKDQNDFLLEKSKTGTLCVEAVMGQGIDWFDYEKLNMAEQIQYFSNAQLTLQNPVFKNEVDRLIATWIQHGIKNAKDFQEVHGMRMCINALSLLRERLESIPDPRKKNTSDDPFSPI